MTERAKHSGDGLERLEGANPVSDPRFAFPPDHPAAQALLKEIVVPDTLTRPSADPVAPSARSRWRRSLVPGAAAAAIAILLAVVVATSSDGDRPETAADPPPAETATDPPPAERGPISLGSASCVELYSLETLGHRELAFDGVVDSVDGDQVTFRINEWYRGGPGETVTLSGASTMSGLTSAGSTVELQPGRRLLVAGDGAFAWSCGFTQPYDPAVAETWRASLA